MATSTVHPVVVEDWTTDQLGRKEIPSGWKGESFGVRAAYDLAIEQDAGMRVLHLASQNEHSTLGKNITGKVNLPIAEDHAKIFSEYPDNPGAIAISIDSNDTHSMAE